MGEQLSRLRSSLPEIGRSVGAKLFFLLAGSLLLVLGILGWLNLRLHQSDLEDLTLLNAESVSEVIKRSTAYHMMRNDREALYHTIDLLAKEPGVRRIRIFNQEGRISFSTIPGEMNHLVEKSSEACAGCHLDRGPVPELAREDRFLIFNADGERIVRVINPITNSRSCSEADCHAHPASQRVLGVLDTNLSLANADEHLTRSTQRVLTFSVIGLVGVTGLLAFFIWRLVHRPVKKLHEATRRLRKGDLGYLTEVRSKDEIGELSSSFNEMSRRLQEAHLKLTQWNRTLEERVHDKTLELRRAHDQMLQAEKLTSLGKLAAVVAHEINNPLSGILTYARLVRKWIERSGADDPRSSEILEALKLIESETRRCGDLVNQLLTFARPTPMNIQPVDLNQTVRLCARLVDHKLDLAAISLDLALDEKLPPVEGDPAQLQQLLMALIMNAVEAMPREGCLGITTRTVADRGEVEVTIRDDGVGIPEEIRSDLFEPFVTTKGHRKGVGLGLAISRQIVERHAGHIGVDSAIGRGTTFTIQLPLRLPREAREPLLKAV